MTGWMVVSDPPDHRRLRALAANAFSPKRVEAMEDEIQRLVDQTLDEFIASGEEDLIAGFSYPLPATVIAKLIGAREEDTWRFRDWSLALAHVAFGAGGDDRGDRHATAMQGLEQMIEYFGELLEYRRANPGEDMITDLLQDNEKWGKLDDDEIKAMCALMLFAGHETTTSTIASAVLTLIRNPDQLALLQADPDGLAGGAAEEALRVRGRDQDPAPLDARGPRDPRARDQGRRPRVHRAGGREPRPGEVRGPRPRRHHARAEPAHRVRQGHPRVHRRPARAARDAARAGQLVKRLPGPAAGRRRRAAMGSEPRLARARGTADRPRREAER